MDLLPVGCVPYLPSSFASASFMDFRSSSPPIFSSQESAMFDIKLESESEISDMDESVKSEQMNMTASCQDTPDTESPSEESEFSVASSASSAVVSLPEISSGPEDVFETFHPALKTQKYCVKCHSNLSSPFPYCGRCFKDRKRFLPPRPSPKDRKRRKLGTEASGSASSKESSPSAAEEDLPTPATGDLHGTPSASPSVCTACMNASCDGIFVHGEVGHQLFCYKCSQRIWMERKSCPYCNRGISKVLRVYKVG